ncbi:MAG: hypothetical protein JNN03_15535 [Rubrivivax sp.]|nr:hypothetical protein [Rubrivivax sp.]
MEDNLVLTLSLAAIVAREAADLTSAATRIVEQCDDLIRDHLGRSRPVDSQVLCRLASIIDGQREVMSGLSANALVAVRLASKQLSAALGTVRAPPPVDGAATEHEQAAGRLLAVLAQLERAIRSSETQMRDASDSVSQTARRAEQGRVFEGLMGRLLGRRSE